MTKIDRMQVLVLAGLALLLIAVSGCTSISPGSAPAAQQSLSGAGNSVGKVEVFHFHGNQQCDSCVVVGELAEKTVNDNFWAELASGRLVFAHINYDRPENAALTAKYNVTGPSLWIGVYDANGFHRQQDMDVWSLTGDPDACEGFLSELIARRLNGDLS